MPESNIFKLGKFRLSRFLPPNYLPAVIATIVVVIAGILAEHQNRVISEARLRSLIANELNPIRSKLENNINGSIQLVRGLIGTIATEPDMEQQRFAELARSLFAERSQLRNLAAAPDLVVSMVYPMAGNEKAIGLDYRTNENQRASAMRVMQTGKLVLAGPVDLVQGGRGLIGRFPVKTEVGGEKRFWGLVSAVIDIDRLYRDSGLASPELGIEIAIAGRDGLGRHGSVFLGDSTVFRKAPVEMNVALPGGSWRMAAIPKGGWPATPENAWTVRLLIALGGLVIVAPMIMTGRLTAERQENIRRLSEAKRLAEAHSAELEAARHRMEFNALHDPLTGLPNRRFLDQMLADRDQQFDAKAKISIFHIDLDRFKQINDTLGHAAGDEILKHAAELLRQNAREGDFVARIGGDEFVIIRASESPDEDAALASRIIEAMSTPVRYKDQECRIGVSIGIAAHATATDELSQTLVNADIALYEAKRRGRNRHETFTSALKTEVFKTKQTADEILRGLEQNEFVAHFQPQFCPKTLEVIGVEALARWDHPTKGLIGPHAFLKTAEDINAVAAIDQAILEQALFQICRWEANGIRIPKVSVNLSYSRLRDEGLIGRLEQMRIPKGRISFELLESISFDENDVTVLSNIRRIKELGIDIEIDDFGTGYASIISLLKLTPRRLKIDRQLILPILKSPPQRRLAQSIIDIGTSLGIEVIAEGVETLEHAAILKELGCHGLQGYAFARPMSANDLAAFVFEERWRAA